MRRDKKNTVVLLLASTLFTLGACEIALRVFTPARTIKAPVQVPVTAGDKPLEVSDAMRYVAAMDAAPGTDRQWFREDPPPLPNRAAPSAERVERYKDYERRGLFSPQADYVWNRRLVEDTFCSPNSSFKNYPDSVLVFDPPGGNPHPRFRFPVSTNTASGLVTNQFGLRGRPMTLIKPFRTVRIAFLGASTTINNHNYLYSYPERVGHWLNRFAELNHYDVHFEVLNSGREGLNSEDISVILRDELLPLDPDLAVYYEGSNQFAVSALVFPPTPARSQLGANDAIDQHKVPALIREHLALGNLLDRALNGFTTEGEPRKPIYQLRWPAVDEQSPDVDSTRLPLQLPVIVKDLDSIRTGMASIGGQLVLSSFEWLVKDGMPLSPTRHANIYVQLNTILWPARYADIRRLADFQNRVFQRFAAARGVTFIDVASLLPQDPNLFSDAIHMTNTGERMKAWIVFQQLVPLIRGQIESGKLPRPAGAHLPRPPSLATSEVSLRCGDAPAGKLTRIEGAVSLDSIKAVSSASSTERGRPIKVVTPRERWAYAAAFPLRIPGSLTGRSFVLVRARVVSGHVGLGILDHKTNTFQLEKNIDASPGLVDIYVPVLKPEAADELIVRNTAEGGVRSEVLIDDVALIVSDSPK